jgi:hypothetical protein
MIARWVREIREDLYGENGITVLAEPLNVPAATWLNYERAVTMPADIMLEFLDIIGTDPHWLLTGGGAA